MSETTTIQIRNDLQHPAEAEKGKEIRLLRSHMKFVKIFKIFISSLDGNG